MTLERGAKSVTKVVRLLTDPIPQLVSLVEHGANQTPFKVLKHAEIARDLHEDTSMAGKQVKSVKEAGKADLHKMIFKSSDFADEAAVKKYMDANAYSNYTVTKTDDGFEVFGHEADAFEAAPQAIEAQKGLTLFVGKLKAEPEAEATTKGGKAKPAAKATVKKSAFMVGDVPAQEVAQKWSGWMAQYSDATTLKEALDAGADGLPPGIYEVNVAFYSALTNVLSGEGDTGPAVTALCGELATVINALQAVFATVSEEATRAAVTKAATRITVTVTDDAHKKDDAVKTEAEKAADVAAEAARKATAIAEAAAEAARKATATAEDAAGKVTATTGDKDKPKEGEKKPEGEKKEGEKEPAKKTGEAETPADAVVKAITDAMSPLAASMTKLAETVAGLQEASAKAATDQSARHDALSESVTKAVERLDTIDKDRGQTRKSADLTGAQSGTQKAEPERQIASRATRNLLGFRNRA